MNTHKPTRRQLLQGLAAGAGATLVAQYVWAADDDQSTTTVDELVDNVDGTVTIVAFDNSGNRLGEKTVPLVRKTEAEWRAELSAEAYKIMRQRGTERAFTGKHHNPPEQHAIYRCKGCDTALYDSKTQFHSGTGWPSFYQPIAAANVLEVDDNRHGMNRTGILCARCHAHHGHKFHDGPPPTGLRYCMNSAALSFHPIESA